MPRISPAAAGGRNVCAFLDTIAHAEIEGLLAQVLDRLTRMEERQNAQSAQIAEQSSRIRELELANANTSALKGRWVAVGAVALVALGAIGGFLSRIVAPGILE
ncbi:hypothetical protein A8U91_00480 [Halomonas elongata]|uniref:Uncharacterized protein n=1 Tax=Halomonas elongata TaxID=2746 RepID=A0A1B8P1S4_HALEL|nr:hypothetical protein [Halomonas elongata]OBX36143.1 hypothetical protein A8U91_00480 [Halomonas elongata]